MRNSLNNINCFAVRTTDICPVSCFRFNTRDSDGVVVDENRASCIMPTFTEAEGWVDFEVSLNGGPYYWKGMFYVGKVYIKRKIIHIS